MRLDTRLVLCAAVLLAGCSSGGVKSSMSKTPATPSGSAERTVNAVESGRIGEAAVSREVRHELVMLPYYGVFDNLAYQVNDGTVTLLGQVTRPTLKTDAENAVKNIEGVRQVVNNIQVLPLSARDDQIRMAEYRAIYSDPALQRYALQAIPPIHIVVENGHVTLDGEVASDSDKNMAGVRAGGVAGVMGVTNSLRVGQ